MERCPNCSFDPTSFQDYCTLHREYTTTFYTIVDHRNGNVWSRNRWGNPNSTPDLYATKKAAQYQLDKGKLALNQRWNPTKPVIVQVEVTRR